MVYDISTQILVLTEPNNKNLVPTLRDVQKLKVFKNRMLRRVFGPEEEEVHKKFDCRNSVEYTIWETKA
jgi:hypothetical protein